MSSSTVPGTISRTLSSEAVAAALKASPALSIRTTNLDFKETTAPPPSPVDFDWSPGHSFDDQTPSSATAESLAAEWRREMHVGA